MAIYMYGHASNKPLTKHDYLVLFFIIIITLIVVWICIKIMPRLFFRQSNSNKTKSKIRLLNQSSIKKRKN